MKKIILIIATLILSVSLVACIEQKERTGEKVTISQTISVTTGKDAEGNDITEKRTVDSEVFINPKRVASFSYGAADMLYEVGFKKAGITKFGISKGSSLPSILNQFNDKQYPNIGTLFVEDMEALDLFNPELIILDGRSSILYSKLDKSFPNADIIDVSNTNFSFEKQKEVVNVLGLIFPKVKTELDAEIAKIELKFSGIKDVTKNIKASFLMSNGDKLSTFGKGSRYNSIFDEFGFMEADPNNTIGDQHGNKIDYEYLTELNPDYIIFLDRASVVTGGESGLDNFLKQGIAQGIDAIKNEKYTILNAEAWYLVSGSFISTNLMIDDVLSIIAKIS